MSYAKTKNRSLSVAEMNDFGTPRGFGFAQPPILRNSKHL